MSTVNRRRVQIASGFLAYFLVLGALPASAAEEVAALGSPLQDCGATVEGRTVVKKQENLWIETVRGTAARANLLNAMSKRPEAFRAIRSDLERRGFAPTDQVLVFRTLALSRSDEAPPQSTVFERDTTVGDSSGEIIIWSWDDGDPNTWEGSVYVEHYSQDYQGLYEGQISVSESPFWNWGSLIWQNREPRVIEYSQQLPLLPNSALGALGTQGGTPGLLKDRSGSRMPPYLRCWLGGVWWGCGGAALGCRYTGPLYLECLAWSCGGTTLLASFGCLFLS